ncbi:MAG: transglycosylase SLT domain-containing protein [Gammaproteobacteria bacterium]|nr:transglycosylase SLT domain-containing protein [Gammaproteobacteria bacterium]
MQDDIKKSRLERHETELHLLNLRLATAEAECERIQQELLAFDSSQTKTAAKAPWHGYTLATASVMAIITLSFVSVYHDALSNVKENSQYDTPAMGTLVDEKIVSGKHLSTIDKKSSSRSARAKKATTLQWGPSLLMAEAADKTSHTVFDPIVKQQQENLLTLGFAVGKADGFKGARTRQAIEEFRALYLPDSGKQLKDADLTVLMANYANLALIDAARFGIDHGIVAAIRLSSVRTGVDFSYLMKLAAAESNFKPKSKSATSSATGMYQFTHDTWLNTLEKHGAKYGLVGDYASNIEHYETRYGYQRPIVRNKAMYQHLLELRKNPRVSAIMAAETIRDSEQILTHSFDRQPTQTDLYLTHFLGTNEAITFLRSLEQNPEAHAVELFPEAASSNRDIFHPRSSTPRTVDEVYALFGKKFTTSRYDDLAAN